MLFRSGYSTVKVPSGILKNMTYVYVQGSHALLVGYRRNRDSSGGVVRLTRLVCVLIAHYWLWIPSLVSPRKPPLPGGCSERGGTVLPRQLSQWVRKSRDPIKMRSQGRVKGQIFPVELKPLNSSSLTLLGREMLSGGTVALLSPSSPPPRERDFQSDEGDS